jgi:hypothetical protein
MPSPILGARCAWPRTDSLRGRFLFCSLFSLSLSYDDLMYRLPAMLLSLISMTMGLIGWAVWTAMGQRNYTTDWHYSWGHGLALGAWLLPYVELLTQAKPTERRERFDQRR